ncbi:hypothetical protein ES703_67129 [subsurface metagenome]
MSRVSPQRTLTKELLITQYLTLKKSTPTIAKEFGYNESSVYQKLKQFSIPTRNLLESLRLKYTYISLPDLTKELLTTKYLIFKKSISDIAEELGYSRDFVHRKLKQFNIPRRNLSESQRLWKCNHVLLSGAVLEFLTGELLGDGHLDHSGPVSSAYLTSSKHVEYVIWLAKVFKGFGIGQAGKIRCQTGTLRSKKYPNRIYRFKTFHYISRRYVELRTLQEKWYRPATREERERGKKFVKIVPTDLVLTPLMCRQWYLGDGSLGSGITLNTQGFTTIEINFLASLLAGLELKTTGSDTRLCGTTYVWKKSVKDFLDYIGLCPNQIKPIFGYKWERSRS